MSLSSARLYCILDLDYVAQTEAARVTSQLLEGGADVLQLRGKNHDLETIRKVGRSLLPLCRAAGVPFILNDYPELVAELDADGVHIGQDDGSFAKARAVVGEGKIIGRSTHSLEQARAALAAGFDYIGFGPLFPTPTKRGRPGIGLLNISFMEEEIGSKIPAFCIGGITPATLPEVLAAGARRIVVVSALLRSPDIRSATRQFKTLLA
jgi:thiamine-phosphate pyrophosphorylase